MNNSIDTNTTTPTSTTTSNVVADDTIEDTYDMMMDDDVDDKKKNNDTKYVKNEDVEDDNVKEEGDDDEGEDDDEVWEHLDSSIHTILLSELWMNATNHNEMLASLNRLWDAMVVVNTTTDTTGNVDTTNTTPKGTSIVITKPSDETNTITIIELGREIFYRLGGYTILLGLLKKYSSNGSASDIGMNIMIQCLAIIGTICRSGHDDLVECTIFAGAVPTIVNVMTLYPSNIQIQMYGCDAIKSLTSNEQYTAGQHLCTGNSTGSITTANGLACIITAMKLYPTNDMIQYCGCSILWNVSYDDYIPILINAGAMGVLAAAVEQYNNKPSSTTTTTTATTTTTTSAVINNADIPDIAKKAMIQLL